MRVLITGSAGLVGSEACYHYASLGSEVHGVDNLARALYFGPSADTHPILDRIVADLPQYQHHHIDVRRAAAVRGLFRAYRFDVVIHCAAQPSHELSAAKPALDFHVNTVGTFNILEAARLHCPEAVVVVLSTNKVYGDRVNQLHLIETETRFDFASECYSHGIDESFGIDQTLHSPFGAAKAAADLLAQEYARYYGLQVGVFRCGCVTGRRHTAVEAHGFLAFLCATAKAGGKYTVIGFKGKQVRDQLHSTDLIAGIDAFVRAPRPAEVYNLGGGRASSVSVREAIGLCEAAIGHRVLHGYCDKPRHGDHICWITDTRKFRSHYPGWTPQWTLGRMIEDMVK